MPARRPNAGAAVAVALLALLAASASVDARRDLTWWWRFKKPEPEPTIAEVATENNLNSFVTAAMAAQQKIIDAVTDPDTVATVLAPSDAAFKTFLNGNMDILEDQQRLTNLLAYHILPGVIVESTAATAAGVPVETLLPDSRDGAAEVTFRAVGGGVVIDDASGTDAVVQIADVSAGKSLVHVIDKVLVPPPVPTLASVAVDSEVLSTLVEAVLRSPTVAAAAYDPHTEVTLLAPSNQAFADFLTANGIPSLDDIPVEMLTEVLLYHLVPTVFTAAEAIASAPADFETLLSGRKVSTSIVDGGLRINDDVAPIATDIPAGRSIVHVINQVLSPPMLPTILDVASGVPELSVLVEAVKVSRFAGAATNDTTALTVLAPTNAAFEVLLADLDITVEQLLAPESRDLLDQVLANHLIGHPVPSSQFGSRKTIVGTLLHGGYLTIQVVREHVRIAVGWVWWGNLNNHTPKVVTADVHAGNSIVHVIDKVLVPASWTRSWGNVLKFLRNIFH